LLSVQYLNFSNLVISHVLWFDLWTYIVKTVLIYGIVEG